MPTAIDARDIARQALVNVGVDTTPPPAPPEVLKARRDLVAFGHYVWRGFQSPPHIRYVADALRQVLVYLQTGGAQGIGRLLIELPVRHGKSRLAARLFPALALGMMPNLRLIVTSHTATLSGRHGRYIRNAVQTRPYQRLFPAVQLASDSQARDAWDLADPFTGGLLAIGKGGAVVGHDGHLIIGDDLFSGRADAESQTSRDNTWTWLQDDLMTRLEPGGAVVLIGNRWHEDDVHGRIRQFERDEWQIVRLPALAEANDPLGRAEGEALWADRFSMPMLRAIERRMGDYSFAGLYQQRPTSAEGGLIQRAWFDPLIDQCPPIVRAVRFWDLAMSERTSADYTAGVKLGVGEDGHTYILDVARERVEWGKLPEYMAQVILADGRDVAQGIEQKGYMTRAIQTLNADPRLHGYSIQGYPVDTDKVTRALSFVGRLQSKQMHALNRHWATAYIEELCSFPKGAHDDQVDATSGAWAMLEEGDAEGAAEAGEVYYEQEYRFSVSDY